MPFIDLDTNTKVGDLPATGGLSMGGKVPVPTPPAPPPAGQTALPAAISPATSASSAALPIPTSPVKVSAPGIRELDGPAFEGAPAVIAPPPPVDNLANILPEQAKPVTPVSAPIPVVSNDPLPALPVASSVSTSTPPVPDVAPKAPVAMDDIVIGTENLATRPSASMDLPAKLAVEPPLPQETQNTSATPPVAMAPLPKTTPKSVAAESELPPIEKKVEVPANPILPPKKVKPVEFAPQPQKIIANPKPVNSGDDKLPAIESKPDLEGKEYTLNDILKQALEMDASDVHLNVGYRAMARKDGELVAMQSRVLDDEAIQTMLSEILAQRPEIDVAKVKDLDIAYQLTELQVRFRVNIFYERGNIAAAFRLVPTKIRTVEELHLPGLIKQFTNLEQGLILVTGTTGSGKTTTIASLLNEINQTQNKHIVTVEDPIEYIYPKGLSIVSQRGMNDDSLSWKNALKSVLRQDPDVVLIGEMRDLETISTAMTIAETGHLVFATLHTNNAAQSVDRIIDVFPEHQQNQIRTQLANVLTAVVSQKLVPTSAGGGRRAAVELLIANSAVQAAIREGKVHQIDNIIQTSAEMGMISMEKSLVNMVKQGLISPEQAQQFANKPNDVISLLR